MRESDLAQSVRDYLEAEGWTTYAEVRGQDTDAIADIVATRGPVESMIVECKATRCRTVIVQSIRWEGQATMVYVAVPAAQPALSEFWNETIARYGIGEFWISKNGDVEQVRSPVRRKVDGLGIRASLREEQKGYTAGNADGARWSPSSDLRDRFLAVVQPGDRLARMDDFTEREQYQIRRLLKNGAIKGWEVRHGGKVFPVGWDRHSVKRSAQEGESE